MITLLFLAGWAVRSSILILSGALLLGVLRVKNPSVRLASWTAVLCGSLAIPLIGALLPELPVLLPATVPTAEPGPAPIGALLTGFPAATVVTERLDWARAGASLYFFVAGLLAVRLLVGSVLASRLLRSSRGTGIALDGIRVLESGRVAAPVTLGLSRPAVILPHDWRQWNSGKLGAVLAHERSHALRRDPAVQLLSAGHRALLWCSPLSWFLHRRIVQLAEEASDNAAIAATGDRASYAELLLDFMARGVGRPGLQAVHMARYGKPEDRIHRILDGRCISFGVTRRSVAAIVLFGLPSIVVAGAVGQRHVSQAPEPRGTLSAPTPASAATPAQDVQAPSQSGVGSSQQSQEIRRYVIRIGDSVSGSWDSRDPVDEEALRRSYGDRYAWFRQGAKEYVITDSGVLAEFEKAMEPQKKVNKLQSEVNSLQAGVNEKQSAVNAPQQKVNAFQQQVNAAQREVNRRQDLANQLQHAVQEGSNEELIRRLEDALRELRAAKSDVSQETVNRLQAEVNKAQQEVNKSQADVNLAQEQVNQQQERVNEEQRRVSAEYNRRIRAIFESAVRRGLARPRS